MMYCKFFTIATLSIVCLCQAFAAPFTPQMILKDGVDVSISVNPYTQESGEARKGTIAATLNNIANLNLLIAKETNEENEHDIQAIIEAIDPLIPSLNVIGVFDLFEPIYWVGKGEQIGRIVVLSLYIKRYPEKNLGYLKEPILLVTSQVTSPSLRALFQSL